MVGTQCRQAVQCRWQAVQCLLLPEAWLAWEAPVQRWLLGCAFVCWLVFSLRSHQEPFLVNTFFFFLRLTTNIRNRNYQVIWQINSLRKARGSTFEQKMDYSMSRSNSFFLDPNFYFFFCLANKMIHIIFFDHCNIKIPWMLVLGCYQIRPPS